MTRLRSILLLSFHSTFAIQARHKSGKATQGKSSKEASVTDAQEGCLLADGADRAHPCIAHERGLGVNAIQTNRMKDWVVERGAGIDFTSVMDRHIKDLRKVLTPEHFDQWNAW